MSLVVFLLLFYHSFLRPVLAGRDSNGICVHRLNCSELQVYRRMGHFLNQATGL